MYNLFLRISFITFILLITVFINTAYSEQFAIVYRDNGDRITGRWINSTDQHFEIEYNGQVLRFPLEGNTIHFISDLENVPNQKATKHYHTGLDLLDIELPELAKCQFEAALEEAPKYLDAHYQLGLLNKTAGNIDKTIIHFRSVLLIDPNKIDLVPLLQDIGENAVTEEEYRQAVNAYQLILKHYPDHQIVARLSYQTGFILVENLEDDTLGLDVLQNAIKQFPHSSEHEKAVYLIGNIQSESGELTVAKDTFQQFLRLYPESDRVEDVLLSLAIVYLQLRDKDRAVQTANFIQGNTEDPSIAAQAKDIVSASVWNIYTNGLPDLNIQTMAVDGESLWIGTPKGIAQIEIGGPDEWIINEGVAWMINSHVKTVPDVQTIAVNASGIWVGTRNQGIIYYNKNTNEVQNYTIRNSDGLPITWVRDIKMDDKEIWYATDSGVYREIISTGKRYPYYGNNPVPNDVHSIALTPETAWVGTTGNDIAIFNREIELWKPQSFLDITQDTKILGFDVVGNKVVISMYNKEGNFNGFFHANWDGTAGKFTPINEGTEMKLKLENIYVTGTVDNGQIPLDNGEPNPKSLILWIAENENVNLYFPYIDNFGGVVGYPKIAMEDIIIQCIVVNKNRAWIGTNKGVLTIDKDKIVQPAD
ncbi:MAG: tetratricopeptide repeat protein [Candidatus Poribacteria bacterium]|nr:tetratricopeptide repeat protein [Candidatus Poribacteria bacterium]